jgi:hypothetical protein
MARLPSDYALVRENDELRRRVDRLEQKMGYLQKQNMEMYKVLLSKNSFLDFEFHKDIEEKVDEERIARERNRRMMAAFRDLTRR